MTKCLIECLITYFYYLFLFACTKIMYIYSLFYIIDQSNTRVRSTPLKWVNRSESSSEIAEEDVSSSSITLVDEGGVALIKGRVY